jgi:hypothetical protein
MGFLEAWMSKGATGMPMRKYPNFLIFDFTRQRSMTKFVTKPDSKLVAASHLCRFKLLSGSRKKTGQILLARIVMEDETNRPGCSAEPARGDGSCAAVSRGGG